MLLNNIRKVLDLGAGHGRDSIFFASNGIEVEALDYSAIAVEILGFSLSRGDWAKPFRPVHEGPVFG